jgi:hypothetical protein
MFFQSMQYLYIEEKEREKEKMVVKTQGNRLSMKERQPGQFEYRVIDVGAESFLVLVLGFGFRGKTM